MREELLSGISRLCLLFPPLRPCIRYSEVLSQEEVDLFAAFVNGHVSRILHDFSAPEAEHQLSLLLKGSFGLSRIHSRDVLFVENLLSAASGNDTSFSQDLRGSVDFLRSNRKLWWCLHNAYEKIVKNNLVDTCPLVVSKTPFIERFIPGLHNFQEFHKLFHESIHCVLEENWIYFNDEALDEGLVVYLHQQVFGKNVCSMHYVGEKGEQCSKDNFIYCLKNMSATELKAL